MLNNEGPPDDVAAFLGVPRHQVEPPLADMEREMGEVYIVRNNVSRTGHLTAIYRQKPAPEPPSGQLPLDQGGLMNFASLEDYKRWAEKATRTRT